jgi:hypothetical protein
MPRFVATEDFVADAPDKQTRDDAYVDKGEMLTVNDPTSEQEYITFLCG